VYKIKITKETRFIFLFGAILVLCISSVVCLSNVSLGTINSEVNQAELRPKSAGYWNLTGSKILVDDSDPNYNWSYTASTYDWCSGSGTWGDPYVIENVYIDGQSDVPETPGKIHSENCISIRNSIKPFIIRNCTILRSGLEEYDSGIYIRTVQNGIIYNNTINYCGEGVYVDWYSRNITISENIFISDNVTAPAKAIQVAYLSHNITICGNYFFDYYESVSVGGSDNCTVENNLIENTYMKAGVYFGYSDYGKILNNTLKFILVSSGSGHEVSDNIVENCANSGIRISACPNTTITGNKITNCDTGINIMASDNNTIKNNSVASNTAYGIYLDSNTEDSLIYLNQIFDNGIQAYDQGSNNKWDNGSIGNYYGDYSGKDANDDGIGDTPYTIPGIETVKDNYPIWWDPPIISIISPLGNEVFGHNSPEYSLSIEGVPDTMWYIIEGIIGIFSITELTGTVNQSEWEKKGHGEMITLSFYANDSLGYLGFKEVIIWKDLVAPKITINSPTPNQLCGVNSPTFSLTIIEEDLVSAWYTIEGLAGTFLLLELNGTLNQDAWDNVPEGDITITFHAIDRAGNIGTESVTVIKSIPSPPVIPGYNLCFLLGILSFVAIIIRKKIKKS